MPLPIANLIALAIASLVLDALGATAATELRADWTLALFGARVALDIAIVAALLTRRRFIWITVTTIYAFAILWRSALLFPALLGFGNWPASKWAMCLLLANAAVAAGSIALLLTKTVKTYFDSDSTAHVGNLKSFNS